jgi:hypothetical protein
MGEGILWLWVGCKIGWLWRQGISEMVMATSFIALDFWSPAITTRIGYSSQQNSDRGFP